MDDSVKVKFVRALVHSDKPGDLPKFYEDFYDLVTRRCGELISQPSGPPKTEWPMVAACAEFFHRIDERLKALEAKQTTSSVQELSYVVGPDEPDPTARKIDLRTKEGRALRQAQAVGA